jgi:hypothetical protein
MQKKKIIGVVLTLVFVIAIIGFMDYCFSQWQLQHAPTVAYVPVYNRSETVRVVHDPPVTITNTITNTIETVHTQNVTEYIYQTVNGKWIPWKNIGELTNYVNEHLAQIWGVNYDPDCDDYALLLSQNAYTDGYKIWPQLIEGGEICGTYGKHGVNVSGFTKRHMADIAIVGNSIYFIEPQKEYFRIVYVCPVD